MTNTRRDLIYADECYEVMGLIFGVFHAFGYGHKEKFYQKAIAQVFEKNNIDFREQVRAKVVFRGKEIGLYILDFVVFGKIAIELKQRNFFSPQDIKQLYAYLKATGFKLGLLVQFTSKGVQYKRIVNLI